jgi:hypothetical protein
MLRRRGRPCVESGHRATIAGDGRYVPPHRFAVPLRQRDLHVPVRPTRRSAFDEGGHGAARLGAVSRGQPRGVPLPGMCPRTVASSCARAVGAASTRSRGPGSMLPCSRPRPAMVQLVTTTPPTTSRRSGDRTSRIEEVGADGADVLDNRTESGREPMGDLRVLVECKRKTRGGSVTTSVGTTARCRLAEPSRDGSPLSLARPRCPWT